LGWQYLAGVMQDASGSAQSIMLAMLLMSGQPKIFGVAPVSLQQPS
jgi:hypothetical protein